MGPNLDWAKVELDRAKVDRAKVERAKVEHSLEKHISGNAHSGVVQSRHAHSGIVQSGHAPCFRPSLPFSPLLPRFPLPFPDSSGQAGAGRLATRELPNFLKASQHVKNLGPDTSGPSASLRELQSCSTSTASFLAASSLSFLLSSRAACVCEEGEGGGVVHLTRRSSQYGQDKGRVGVSREAPQAVVASLRPGVKETTHPLPRWRSLRCP